MKQYKKQVKILAAIGFLLIAAVFITAAVTPLAEQRVFRGGTDSAAQSAPVGQTQEVSLYPIDLNSASSEQLQILPGIGEKTAAAIIRYREKHGAFRTKEELMKVKGIGTKTYDALKDLICV